jgi:phosphatidylserine/phosphatidylglycerophosphate/cardiolipin synthase-like enzyme
MTHAINPKAGRVLAFLLLFTSGTALAFQFPGASVEPPVLRATGTIQLAFTPGDDAANLVIQAIQGARKQVLVQAFSFTHRKIAEALIEAKRRGIDVQLVADREQTRKMERSVVPSIAAGGVPTFIDADHDSAHNKVMIIDAATPQSVVITGSFNFTQAAQHRNAENLLLLRGNPQLTQAYLDNWQRHRAHSRPY